MQIAIEIRHEFGDVSAFANFAARLKDLFAEFAIPTVRSAALVPAPTFEKSFPVAVPDESQNPSVADRPLVAAGKSNSDTVTEAPSLPGSAHAEALSSVPVSDTAKPPKARGPYKKKSEPVEAPAPVSLPAAGGFGGPAVASSPPATAPAATDVPPASVAASNAMPLPEKASIADDGLNEHRAFCLEWVGRNRNGHARYMKVLGKYQDKAAGKVRLQDFSRPTREAIIIRLKEIEAEDLDE